MQGKKHIRNVATEAIVNEMLLKGYNYTQISEKLGICTKLLSEKYSDVIKDTELQKDINDLKEVKTGLLKKAVGFNIEEKTYRTKILDDGTEVEYLAERKEKQVIPDTTAQIFYLVNKSNGEYVSINKDHANNENVNINVNIRRKSERH